MCSLGGILFISQNIEYEHNTDRVMFENVVREINIALSHFVTPQ